MGDIAVVLGFATYEDKRGTALVRMTCILGVSFTFWALFQLTPWAFIAGTATFLHYLRKHFLELRHIVAGAV